MSKSENSLSDIVLEKKTTVIEEDIERLLKTFSLLNATNVWSMVTDKNDFTAKRFEFGYVNDIVCCELTADAKQKLGQQFDDFPSIVVKYTAKQSFLKIDPLEAALILVCASGHKISPRVFYLDNDCQISEYIENRHYNQEDDLDKKTVKIFARKLARFHHLNPPISKNSLKEWTEKVTTLVKNNDRVFEKVYLNKLNAVPELKQKYYDTLMAFDFKNENDYVWNLKSVIGSPLVFSHNDLNRGNRLVSLIQDRSGKSFKEIYFIDLDFSTYNDRGIDLGRYFSNYQHQEDLFGDEGFPSDNEMDVFLEEYRQEMAILKGPKYLESKINSLKQLRLESKVYAMLAYVFDAGFGTFLLENASTEKSDMERSLKIIKARFEGYLKLKQRFIEDGTISAQLEKKVKEFKFKP